MRKYVIALCLVITACTSSLTMVDRGESGTFEISKVTFAGVTVSEKEKQIYDDKQLELKEKQTIAEAKAKAKAETILFTITNKQKRENIKQDTAKYFSWVCFAGVLVSIFMGVITKGYIKWGTMAASLFIGGMVALLIPELIVYLKWAIIVILGGGIILGLSHAKEFSFNQVIANLKNSGNGSNKV